MKTIMKKNKKHRILLCEDDTNLGEVLKLYLEINNYDVTLERDGRVGLMAFSSSKFDLCLLDVMMPHVDGFKLAENIREIDPDVPLFFLSAKTMKQDILQGYKLGADDYITKPFDSDVLLHKIKAIIKRNDDQVAITDSVEYSIGKYYFVPRIRELTIDKKTIKLTEKETGVLQMLCSKLNDVAAREDILRKVWGSDSYFNGRSMDVYIARLRKILIDDENIELINLHNNGYRLIVKK